MMPTGPAVCVAGVLTPMEVVRRMSFLPKLPVDVKNAGAVLGFALAVLVVVAVANRVGVVKKLVAG